MSDALDDSSSSMTIETDSSSNSSSHSQLHPTTDQQDSSTSASLSSSSSSSSGSASPAAVVDGAMEIVSDSTGSASVAGVSEGNSERDSDGNGAGAGDANGDNNGSDSVGVAGDSVSESVSVSVSASSSVSAVRKRGVPFDRLKTAVDEFLRSRSDESLKMKSLMNYLKTLFGKKVRKQKEQIREYLTKEGYRAKGDGETQTEAEQTQQQEDDEPAEADAEAEAGAEVDAEGDGDGAAEGDGDGDGEGRMDEDLAAEEDDEDEEKVSKKGNKRSRDQAEDDEDYEESSSKKKAKKSKKSGAGGDSSASSTSSKKESAIRPPKSALKAYSFFVRDERKRLTQRGEKLNQIELFRRIGAAWKKLTAAEKAPYERLQQEDAQRYETEMAEFEQKYPTEAAKTKEKKKSKKKTKKSKRGEAKYDDDEEGDEDEKKKKEKDGAGGEGGGRGRGKKELDEIEAALQAARPRRQRKSEYSEEDRNRIVNEFIGRMRQATQDDRAKAKRGEPALEKLKLLPQVESEVQKREVQGLLMDRIVNVLREWLEPVGTEKLPNIRLRTAIYRMLDKLPIGESELESSSIGHLLLENLNSQYETTENKVFLVKLIEKLIQKVLANGATSYRKIHELEERDPENLLAVQRRRQVMAARLQAPSTKTQFSRALIPQPATFDFALRPRNVLSRQAEEEEDHDDKGDQAMEAGERKELSRQESLMKRLDKQNRSASGGRKVTTKVDIQGRRLF